MARKDEVASLIKSGHNITEIRSQFGISIDSVKSYLYLALDEGLISRSDIITTVPVKQRQIVDDFIRKLSPKSWEEVYTAAREGGQELDPEVLKIYLDFRESKVPMGEMYEFLSNIEVTLHQDIRRVLVLEYGESNWWRRGIPMGIRKACAALREEDTEPAVEPYCYTNFIHLQEILDRQWALFSRYLPPEIIKEKKRFLDKFTRLNQIRNGVMHPVKGLPVTDEDFTFVRTFYESIRADKWQALPPG
jgi:hypothetical protein